MNYPTFPDWKPDLFMPKILQKSAGIEVLKHLKWQSFFCLQKEWKSYKELDKSCLHGSFFLHLGTPSLKIGSAEVNNFLFLEGIEM